MRIHLAILRTAALLVPEQQRAEWFAEWRSELWHAWQNPQETNLIAFCLGGFKDAWWLRRYGPVPRSYGVLHLDVPVTPAVARNFPEPHAAFLKSPAQCLSFLGGLAAIAVLVAFLVQPVRDTLMPRPYPEGRSLLMISPPGARDPGASMANGLLDPYPTVSVEQFRTWKQSPMREFAGLAFYLPQVLPTAITSGKPRRLSVARTSASLFSMLHITLPPSGLIVSDAAWRKYFHSNPHAVGQVVRVGGNTVSVIAILPASHWRLPGNFDAWLIEDEQSLTRLPPAAKGFVLGKLTAKAMNDHAFPDGILNYVSLDERNRSFLPAFLPMFVMTTLLVPVTAFFLARRLPLAKIQPVQMAVSPCKNRADSARNLFRRDRSRKHRPHILSGRPAVRIIQLGIGVPLGIDRSTAALPRLPQAASQPREDRPVLTHAP